MTEHDLQHLTPAEREAWGRCAQATPGPWDEAWLYYALKYAYTHMGDHVPEGNIPQCSDVAFIRHTRRDLPAALVRIAKMAARLEYVEEFVVGRYQIRRYNVPPNSGWVVQSWGSRAIVPRYLCPDGEWHEWDKTYQHWIYPAVDEAFASLEKWLGSQHA